VKGKYKSIHMRVEGRPGEHPWGVPHRQYRLRCRHCGVETIKGAAHAKYCSVACRVAAHRANARKLADFLDNWEVLKI